MPPGAVFQGDVGRWQMTGLRNVYRHPKRTRLVVSIGSGGRFEEIASARALAGKLFAMYGTLPSYRAMMDEEGVEGPADIAMIGDETALEAGIQRLADAGVTDFNANVIPDGKDREGSMQRTTEFLAELARR